MTDQLKFSFHYIKSYNHAQDTCFLSVSPSFDRAAEISTFWKSSIKYSTVCQNLRRMIEKLHEGKMKKPRCPNLKNYR